MERGRSDAAVADTVRYVTFVRKCLVRIALQNPQDVAGCDTAEGDFALQPDISFPGVVIYFAALQSPRKALEVLENMAVVLSDRGVEWGADDLRVPLVVQVKQQRKTLQQNLSSVGHQGGCLHRWLHGFGRTLEGFHLQYGAHASFL